MTTLNNEIYLSIGVIFFIFNFLELSTFLHIEVLSLDLLMRGLRVDLHLPGRRLVLQILSIIVVILQSFRSFFRRIIIGYL